MYILNIYKTRNKLIDHWFYNLKTNIINTEILLLSFQNKDDSKKFFKSDFCKNNKSLIVTSLQKLTKIDLNYLEKKNIILIENKEVSFNQLGIIKDINVKVLFYSVPNLIELDNLIHNSIYSQKTKILQQDVHHFYLQNTNPEDIVILLP